MQPNTTLGLLLVSLGIHTGAGLHVIPALVVAPQPEATFQPRAGESHRPLLNSPCSSRDLKAKSIHTAVWPRSFPWAKGGSVQDL